MFIYNIKLFGEVIYIYIYISFCMLTLPDVVLFCVVKLAEVQPQIDPFPFLNPNFCTILINYYFQLHGRKHRYNITDDSYFYRWYFDDCCCCKFRKYIKYIKSLCQGLLTTFGIIFLYIKMYALFAF